MTAAVHTANPANRWFDAAMDVIVIRSPETPLGRRGTPPARTALRRLADIGTAERRGISYG